MTIKFFKKLRQIATIALSFALLISTVVPALAQDKAKQKVSNNFAPYVPGEIIIKFKENQAPNNIFLAKHNLRSADKISKQESSGGEINKKDLNIDRMYLAEENDGSDIALTINDLMNDPRIEYAEPNYIINIDTTPNDPSFSSLWGLNNTGQTGGTPNADINAPEAWDIQTGSSNVTIGVIDTGVDYNHQDLAANIWTNPGEMPGNGIDDDHNGYIDDIHGWNFYNNTDNVFDDNGHGTHVSGTIGALGNNGVGVTGVNWSVKIAALKFLNSRGSGSTSGAIAAVNYANIMGFKITNNSWGGGGYSQSLYDAISRANTNGNLFVAAAGNSGVNIDSSPSYPASYNLPNIISVAATDKNDLLASFSNYGATSVDLSAPGVSIYSTTPNSTYSTYSGTSMASPHVAGVAGLVKAQFPDLDAAGIKARILNGVYPIASLAGKTLTGGRLDAYNALESSVVPPTNNKPTAVAGGPYTSTEDIITSLDSSLSSDLDGDQLTYKWDFGDGAISVGTNPLVSHIYLKGGIYTVTLIVNDGKIDSDPSLTTADIAEVNDAPIANAGPDQTLMPGQVVTLSGALSSDEETPAAELTYFWNFGDSTTAYGKVRDHVYDTTGIFTVTLTVTDAGGLSAQDTLLVNVVNADTITITKATYSRSRKELTVEATSSQQPAAILTVQGFGTMAYISSLSKYQYKKRPTTNPGSVTINSSLGGSSTKTITLIK